MHYIDLSHPLTPALPTYPGDPGIQVLRDKALNTDGYNHTSIKTGMHAGTHLDAPSHLTDSPRGIQSFMLDAFAGPAVMLDVRGQDCIDWKIEYNGLTCTRMLLFTGHSTHIGTPDYFVRHPAVTENFAGNAIERGVKLIGMDMPSPDAPPFPVHRLLMRHDVVILENLTNLEALLPYAVFELFAFPLSIAAEGALTRAVARI